MAFNTDKLVFKKLNKLPLTKRIKAAQSNPSVLADLTPTQFAELFPLYYRRVLPDVGGFRQAISKAAAERQAEASASILDRIAGMEKRGEEYAGEIYHKIKRKLGIEKDIPTLSTEQASAFQKLQAGGMLVDSAEGKMFAGLSDKQLASLGISKGKDATGHDIFNYAAPEVSKEEAISRLKSAGTSQFTGREKAVLDMISKREGATDPNTIFGGSKYKSAVGYNKPLTEMSISEVLDMQRKLTSVTAADGVAGGKGTSAVGSGQFVRGTLIANLKALGIPEKEWGNIKFDHNLQQRLTIQNFKDNVGDPNEPRTWNLKRLGSQWESFDTGKGFAPLKSTEISSVYQASSERPTASGPGGSYTDEQITKMMDQLRNEKNDARKQQLANLLVDAGVPTATVSSLNDVQSGGVVGGHFGDSKQCVALSKHFAPSIGPASGWQFQEGTGGIVPGAVIATQSYKDGSGGRMAKDMPDGRSHYHTGVALTRPDAQGNVLIFDQAAGHGSKITKINIYNYNGEKWGAVKGGEPSEKSMQAVNIALSRASESEKNVINESMRGASPAAVASTPEIKPNPDAGGTVPTTPRNQEGKPAPAPAVEVKAPSSAQPVAVPQTATVQAPAGPQPVRYKFNEQSFIKEVRAKNTGAFMVTDDYIMNETLTGFKNTEGVSYDRKTGTLTIKDPNSPAIQKVIADMRANNLDENVFLNKMKEEKKPEATPEKKVEAPKPTPQPVPEKKPAETPSHETPQQQTTKSEVKPQAPKVPGASDGGSFNTPGQVDFYPMDKRDNVAAVDTKTQKPLFTAKGGERIDITPQQKVKDNLGPTGSSLGTEMDALRHEMMSAMSTAGRPEQPQNIKISQASPTSSSFTDDLTKQISRKPYNNPAFERAMIRTRMQESGDPLNDHFSFGNTNY